MPKSSAADLHNYPATATKQFELSPLLLGLIETLSRWIVRRHQRKALSELDEHSLNDVGLSREQASCEAAKPFWKR
jgi:uncharacterized protein YjiS (DUF1127 family)